MGGFGGQGGQTHQGGISVYASGFAVGAKLLESFIGMPGADGIQRFDGGAVGVSGWKLTAMSTRLSSVLFAVAAPMFPFNGFQGLTSGYTSEAYVGFSGNCVDLTLFHSISGGAGNGGMTSAGCSSQIAWLAIGF